MCSLCSTGEEKADAVLHHLWIAETLHKLGDQYKQLAQGTLKPHTQDTDSVGIAARHIIKYLVDDWV